MADVDESAELARLENELASGGPTPEQTAAAEAARVASENAAAEAAAAERAAAGTHTPEEIAAAQAAEAARLAAEEEGSGAAPERVRIKNLPEADRHKVAAATHLASAENIPFDEAWKRVNPEKQQEQSAEPPPDALATLQTELAEVEQTLAAAGDDQSLLTPEILKAFDRKAELRDAIKDEKTKRQRAQAAQVQTAGQEFDSEWDQSEALVEKMFPGVLADENSPLGKAVAAELNVIANDPKHRDYGRADLPELLYTRHAARLGIAAQKVAATPPPAPRVLPASGGARTTPPPINNPAVRQAEFKQREAKALAEDDAQALADLAEEEISGKAAPRHRSLQLA